MTPRELARALTKAASDTKAIDLAVLDLRELTSFTDFFVLCSGTSDRHVRAIVENISQTMKEEGRRMLGLEGQEFGRWVVIDYGDVVVHVFHQDEREFYQIERLWGDAKRVKFKGVT